MPRVWIDIANSPQAQFFKPIADELIRNGIEVIITVRDFGQNVEISRRLFGDIHIVGKHDGKNILRKGIGLFRRAKQLYDFYKGLSLKFELALSHNSYHHIIATRLLGIRTITFMDFEGQKANHLAFRLADIVVVPKCFKRKYLKIYGADESKVKFYDGFKEEVYLWRFDEGEDYFKELGINRNKPICVVRTPPTKALYYKENKLFYEVLEYLKSKANVVLLWRTKEQYYEFKNEEGLIVFDKALNGLKALFWADLFVGAGGTMSRESALLGTPTYSVFEGLKAGVDECMETRGWLKFVKKPDEIDVSFKTSFYKRIINDRVFRQVMDIIYDNL